MEYYTEIKKKNYWYIQQQGWLLQALFGVKEASYKKLCNLWFHLYKVQEEMKLVSNSRNQKKHENSRNHLKCEKLF